MGRRPVLFLFHNFVFSAYQSNQLSVYTGVGTDRKSKWIVNKNGFAYQTGDGKEIRGCVHFDARVSRPDSVVFFFYARR